MCNAAAARRDKKLRVPPSWIEFDIVTSQRQTQSILSVCDAA